MYYYGARYYDPRISIFVSVDPLTEKYPNYTPYHYVHNNPINMVDPTGMEGEDWYTNLENGNLEWFEGSKEIDGYTNIGSSASAVVGDEHYDLKNDGKFENLDTGKEYFKGDSVKTKSGTEIKSNGNVFNTAQSYFRENKQSFLKDSQSLQDTGDNVAAFGFTLSLTGPVTKGTGTAAGGLIATFGNYISGTGLAGTIGTEFMTGDYSTKKGIWDVSWTVGGRFFDYGIDRTMPKSLDKYGSFNKSAKLGSASFLSNLKGYFEKKYGIR